MFFFLFLVVVGFVMVFVNGCVDFFVLVFIVIVYFIILLLFEGEECEFVFLIELFLFKFVLEF